MNGRKHCGRRNRSRGKETERTASCLPFLNTDGEKLFNIYIQCDGGVINGLALTAHEGYASSLEKKIKFLERNIYRDMKGAVSYELPKTYENERPLLRKRKVVPRILGLDAYRAMMRNGDVIPFLGAAFKDQDILEDSVFIATIIVDGLVDNENVIYF